MTRKCRVLLLALTGTLLETAQAQAPPQLRIDSALLGPSAIAVEFSEAVKAAGPHADPTKVRVKNSSAVKATSIVQNLLIPRQLTISLSGPIANPAGTEVCFAEVAFTGPDRKDYLTTTEICHALSADVEAAKQAALAKLKLVPTASSERNIFASGFVTTASTGSVGGADISLNPDLKISGMTTFLTIKKTTTGAGDPRHFEAGARSRTVLPWGRGLIGDIARTPPGASLNALIEQQQGKIFAGALLDFAMKLEGDPTHFDVANAVGEADLHLRTLTKAVAGKKGYWRGFLTPLAFEGGKSLSARNNVTPPPPPGTSPEVDWIARYKAGAGMTFFYDNAENHIPVRRVELDLNVVMRNLFRREFFYDATTKLVDSTGQGVRAYAQADLKFFAGESSAGRYGFKLTYNRGSLPPVFARVKSFQFGFLFESKSPDEGEAQSPAPGSTVSPSRAVPAPGN